MNIALIGYGKMGHMVETIAKARGHRIVSIIDVDNTDDFDSEAFASADVAIEFTNPTAAYGNYLRAFKHNVKVVSGSTGWMKEHGDDVRRMTELIDDYALGYKLAGAGGGGYLYIVAKDQDAAARIKQVLNANRPNANARFVDMSLSTKGLQVSRS